MVKNLSAVGETRVQFLSWEDLPEKGRATHSSIPAWKIPWVEEPGRPQYVGSQRVRHDWWTNTQTYIYQPRSRAFCSQNKWGSSSGHFDWIWTKEDWSFLQEAQNWPHGGQPVDGWFTLRRCPRLSSVARYLCQMLRHLGRQAGGEESPLDRDQSVGALLSCAADPL